MRTLIMGLLSIVLMGSALASERKTGPEQILRAAQDFMATFASDIKQQGFDATFSLGSLDPRLSLAYCDEQNLQVEFSGDPWKSTQPSLLIACDGQRPWRMYLSASLEIAGDALVAARPLNRGERLTRDMLVPQRVVVNERRLEAVSDKQDLLGLEMKRPVNAGTPMSPHLLRTPDAVTRGDHVMISARSGSFSVSARGKALGDAGIGDQVLVENLTSSRRVRARVVAPGRVEIPM